MSRSTHRVFACARAPAGAGGAGAQVPASVAPARGRPRLQSLARASGLCAALAAGSAGAWQLDYSLQGALGYSDNINESASAPVGEAILIPRVDFDFREDGAVLQAHAAGRVEYRDYLQGDFNNEFRGQLSALATWIISPQRLNFDFEDHAAVEPVNTLATNAPNNQQQTNVFTLGPTLNFRLFETLKGQAEVRLSNTTASKTKDFDSDRGMAALRAIHDLNPTDTLSGNVEFQHVHFTDASGGPDYNRADGFARYQSKLSELDLDLAAGYSRLNFSAPGGSNSGPLARGKLTWHATPSQTLALGVLRQYSDASQDLAVDPRGLAAIVSGTGIVVGTTPITSQVYLERRLSLEYAYQNERWHAGVQPYWRKLDYVIDPTLDQKAHGATAGISYRLRPLWTLAFDATEETRDYQAFARQDEDVHLDLSATDRLTRQWSVRADLIRNERHSTAADQRFHENIAFLTVIFTR